jgi:hypothetical protein
MKIHSDFTIESSVFKLRMQNHHQMEIFYLNQYPKRNCNINYFIPFFKCNELCSLGWKVRTVYCVDKANTGSIVSPNDCFQPHKPAHKQRCFGEASCSGVWKEGPWSRVKKL